MNLVRRLRFSAGSLALIGTLAFVAALLMTAAPRLSNAYADAGLRDQIGRAAYQVRDLTYRFEPLMDAPELRPVQVPAETSTFERFLGPELRSIIAQKWSAAQVGPRNMAPIQVDGTPLGDVPLHLGLRTQTGVTEAAALVDGDWPARNVVAGAPIEVAVAEAVADRLGLEAGMTFSLTAPAQRFLPVTIVATFRPIDPAAPIWEPEPELITPFTPVGEDGVPWRGVLLTDDTGIAAAMAMGIQPYYQWRFRFDEQRITTDSLEGVASATIAARNGPMAGAVSQTELDGLLTRFADEVTGVAAILAVVQAGVLATVFGLALLAARGLVERRRTEAALLRARGRAFAASAGAWRSRCSSSCRSPWSTAWLVGRTLPGRPGPDDWLAVLLGLAAVLAVPLLAAATQRKVSFVGSSEMVRPKRSMRRVTAEASVLLLAGVGAFVLNQRGLDPERGVDVFVVSVPVLLAAAVALVALRLLPWPLRQLGRLTARSRGAVSFLGFARAGRATTAGTGPLVVLVVAVSTAIFSAVVASTIADGRDRATDQAVPGDVLVQGFLFPADGAQRLRGVAGVTDVATLSRNPASPLASSPGVDATALTQVYAAAVDGPALARVMAASGRPDTLPAGFADARPTSGPVPAIVSPRVAADVGADGAVEIQGLSYGFTVASVVDTFPGVPAGVSRFVVLPLQAVRAGAGQAHPADRVRGGRRPTPTWTGCARSATWLSATGGGGDRRRGRADALADGDDDLGRASAGAGDLRGQPDARLRLPGRGGRWPRDRAARGRVRRGRRGPGARPDALAPAHHGTVPPAGQPPARLRAAPGPRGRRRGRGRRGRGAAHACSAAVLDLSAFTGGFAVRPRLDPVVAAAVAALVLVAMAGGPRPGAAGEPAPAPRRRTPARRGDVMTTTTTPAPDLGGAAASGGRTGRRPGPGCRTCGATSCARAWCASTRPRTSRWSRCKGSTSWSTAARWWRSSGRPARASRRC